MKKTARRDHLKILAAGISVPGIFTTSCPAERPAVDGLATSFMQEFDVPGFSFAVAKEGKFLLRKSFGLGNIRTGEKLNVAHRFRIASVSKPITSTAVFSLIEKGKLNLSDRVFGKAGLVDVSGPDPRFAKITVKHLLTHTAGGWKNDNTDPMFRHLRKNHSELIAWTIRNIPLKNEPGKSYAYSNFGYCLLGRIIEKVSGQDYDTFVKSTILKPCGITNMELAARSGPLKNEVSYYTNGKPVSFKMNVRRMDSHGGWVGTPTDLVNFAMRVDGFPEPPDLLQQNTLRIMTEREGANPDYACGWSVNKVGNRWHNGSLPGLSSILVRTASGYCWAACANIRKEGIGPAMDRLMWKIAGVLDRE